MVSNVVGLEEEASETGSTEDEEILKEEDGVEEGEDSESGEGDDSRKDDDGKEGGSEEETEADKRQGSLKVIFRGRSVGLEWRLLENRRKIAREKFCWRLIWANLIRCQLISGGYCLSTTSRVKAKEDHIMYKDDVQFC